MEEGYINVTFSCDTTLLTTTEWENKLTMAVLHVWSCDTYCQNRRIPGHYGYAKLSSKTDSPSAALKQISKDILLVYSATETSDPLGLGNMMDT